MVCGTVALGDASVGKRMSYFTRIEEHADTFDQALALVVQYVERHKIKEPHVVIIPSDLHNLDSPDDGFMVMVMVDTEDAL